MKLIKKFLGATYVKIIDGINLVAYYASGVELNNTRKLRSLKNYYKGKQFFVVCNGPSLSPDDLTQISKANFISIGMNHIARIYENTPWRVDFLMVTDNSCYKGKHAKMVKECYAKYKIFSKKQFIKSLSFKGDKIYETINGSRKLLDHPEFSEDLSKVVFAIGTTAYESIEWARYLGAEVIYLIGCDMSYAVNANRDGSIYYNTSGSSHFYGKEKEDLSKITPVQTWEQKVAHIAAEKYSRSHGFRIYNATRGGCLQEYERVDFDELIK